MVFKLLSIQLTICCSRWCFGFAFACADRHHFWATIIWWATIIFKTIFNYIFSFRLTLKQTMQPTRESIYKDSTCELVLLTWAKGDFIPRHYHPNTKCYFMILKGTLVEERCQGNFKIIEADNCFKYIEDCHGPHSVTAINDSVSIHLYINNKFISKL